MFLGYSPDHPDGCFDFLNCETGSLVQSRDVVFDERSVTVPEIEPYLLTEGTRSLPDWMEFNPFTPEGTGPDVVGTKVADAPKPHGNSRVVDSPVAASTSPEMFNVPVKYDVVSPAKSALVGAVVPVAVAADAAVQPRSSSVRPEASSVRKEGGGISNPNSASCRNVNSTTVISKTLAC